MKQPQALPPVLQVVMALVRHTPLGRGKMRSVILNWLKKYVDYPVITDFRSVPFVLNLDNTTEEKALFGHYNIKELDFIRALFPKSNGVLVDIGANSGFFTQNVLATNAQSTVLAIEPNPVMCKRIEINYALLGNTQSRLILECCAIGAEAGQVELDLSLGLGAANVVREKTAQTISVKMETLFSLLQRHHIDHIDVVKIDVEGYEDKALMPFFAAAPESLFPRGIIIEHTSSDAWQGALSSVLKDKGYIEAGKTRGNLLLKRQ